jgi:hypothetical protein
MEDAEKPKSIGEGCLEFYDAAAKVSVNVVPFEKAAFIPRVGENVYLTGTGDGGTKGGAGTYSVTKVLYLFSPDDESEMPEEFGPGKLLKVTLYVKKVR